MSRSEGFFFTGQGPLIERFGLGVSAGGVVLRDEVVAVGCNIGVLGPKAFFVDSLGLFGFIDCLVVLPIW
jgi:hypothetical protein